MIKNTAIAAALIFAAASGADAATILNGSFESASVNPGSSYVTLGTGSTAIDNWTVTAGTIDYIGGYWTAQDGSRSIDLAGNSPGTISQTIADAIAGQYYTVSFYASKNPDGGASDRTGTVSAGGNQMQFHYSDPNSLTNMNWQLYTFTFLATGSDVLSFAADTSAACCYGPAIDNVGIADAVPEPATWGMLLLGFVGIGLVMRRSRRSTILQVA